MTSETKHIDYETLMIHYLSGEATLEEQRILLDWLKQDPENSKKLNQLRNTVGKCKQIQEKENSFNPEMAFERFEKTIIQKKSNKIRSIILWSSSIAAILILMIGVKLFTPTKTDGTIILGKAKNSKQIIALIDGSTVTLNNKSRLTAIGAFNKTKRTVILKGEAFFDVKHDALHPFVVKVDSVTITVLGTAFDILPDSISHNITITVQRGRVAVMYKKESIIISAGEQATYIKSLQKIGLTKINIANYDSWKTGQLVFNDTPLQEVIETLNKQYSTHFEIGSKELINCKLNASFSYTDIKKVEELLSAVLKVEIKSENGKQFLYCKRLDNK